MLETTGFPCIGRLGGESLPISVRRQAKNVLERNNDVTFGDSTEKLARDTHAPSLDRSERHVNFRMHVGEGTGCMPQLARAGHCRACE